MTDRTTHYLTRTMRENGLGALCGAKDIFYFSDNPKNVNCKRCLKKLEGLEEDKDDLKRRKNKKLAVHNYWIGFHKRYHNVKDKSIPKITHVEVEELIFIMSMYMTEKIDKLEEEYRKKLKK